MDFEDILVYLGLAVWAIISFVIKAKNGDDDSTPTNKRTKNRPRPVILTDDSQPIESEEFDFEEDFEEEENYEEVFETDENLENYRESYKTTDKKQHFTYETMSERDFAQEFSKNIDVEESIEYKNDIHKDDSPLDFSEQEIFKGIVYSEILKRKYC